MKYTLDHLDANDITDRVTQRIHKDMYREVMLLRFIHGMTYEQIAEKVDRTPRQIYNIICKCVPKVF